MDFRDCRSLKEAGAKALANSAFEPRKLMLVFSGATAALLLVATVLNFILQQQIAGTGGLSGLGLRSILETAAQVLQTGTNLVVPFWTMGYVACMLRMVRGQPFDLKNMLDGFRNFSPILRLNLLRALYFMMLAIFSFYLSMTIFEFTPLATPVMELLAPQIEAIEAGGVADLTTVDMEALSFALIPLMVLFAVVFTVVAGPNFYRFRMADYALMDDPKAGARMAIRRSTAMMRGNRLALLKLDLSFWWYYLLDALLLGLCYMDAILVLVGITLPVSASVAWLGFYALYLAAQLGLQVWARNRLESTYAVGYEVLRQELDRKIQEAVERRNAQQQQN